MTITTSQLPANDRVQPNPQSLAAAASSGPDQLSDDTHEEVIGPGSISDLIRAAWETSPSEAGPPQIAQTVLRRLRDEFTADEELWALLADLLPEHVRRYKPRAPSPVSSTRATKGDIQRAYRRLMRFRLDVGKRRWLPLADCTAAEVAEAERIRREQAEANIAVADRLAVLRQKMQVHRARIVSDLPLEIAVEAWR